MGDRTQLQEVVRIRPYVALQHSERLAAQLDAIFFEASGTKTFSSKEARAAFRQGYLPDQGVYDVGFRVVCETAERR